jgi:hypothetical protein
MSVFCLQRLCVSSQDDLRILEMNLALVKDPRTTINPCTGRLRSASLVRLREYIC